MHASVKYIVSLLIAVLTASIGVNNFAQESNSQLSDNRNVQILNLHWKKISAEDFLIRRNQGINSIAILPVRSRQLVKVITANRTSFSISNGSGLFQDTELKEIKTNHYIYQNTSSGLIWLRLQLASNENFSAYTADLPYYSASDFLHPLSKRPNAQGGNNTVFKLSNSNDRVEKVFIDERNPYSFDVTSPGVLLFRHQVDYEQIDGQFDVLYQVAWEDAENKAIRNYTTRPEVGRLYEASCLHQLGQRKDTLISVDKPGRYIFSSNQPIQAEFYQLSKQQILLDKRSQSTPELIASVEQINSDNKIVNDFNTYIDQNLYQEALNQLASSDDNKQILSLIRAKHSFFKPLHPIRLQEQNMLFAYYSIYSDPELPSNKGNEFYLNENLTDAITKKISTGYFYPLGNRSELDYELSGETFENKLRIAVANMQPTNSEINLIYDTGEEQTLSLESSFTNINKKVNVVDVGLTILNQNQLGELATLSNDFAAKKPVAPFLNSVTGLINIPANAKSFTIKSTDPNVWVSVAYPQRSFYRNFEFNKIKEALINQRSKNQINDFITTYQTYKNLQTETALRSSFNDYGIKLDTFKFETRQQLQDWTPYYREIYNTELKIPAQANAQIKLFSLEQLRALNEKFKQQGQHRLRKDTLLAHTHFSPSRQVRQYAYNELLQLELKDERYRQILEIGQMLLIRYADDYVLNDIANIYQRLNQHKKAIFYLSLNPQASNIDYLLASLFYLRQWSLFDVLVEQSDNFNIWNNLKLFQSTPNAYTLTPEDYKFIETLGHSWNNEDRFLLNYNETDTIQSTNTLATKQVAIINKNDSVTITLKGPLNLRLRAATIFPSNSYTTNKYSLNLASKYTDQQLPFYSVPAKSWLNNHSSLVGTFGKIELNVPKGFHEYKLTSTSTPAYVYIENKRNLLGLNLSSEETVDAEFVRENAQFYNRRGANKKRDIGYLKSSCRRLTKLQQRPIRTFQPVEIDLSLRNSWIEQRLISSHEQTSGLNNWLEDTLNSSSSLKVTTRLKNACTYQTEYSEQCMTLLHENLLSGRPNSALNLLEYIDRFPELNLSTYRNDVFARQEWQLQKTVSQSDGRIDIESEFLQEDNSYILALEDNFSQDQLSSLFITDSKVQGFKFSQAQKQHRFEFKRLSQNFMNINSLIIQYQIDNGPVQSFEMDNDSLIKDFTLNNNESELRFWLSEESNNEYVSIFHSDTELSQLSKEYFVATPEIPVILTLKGPQRLKVISQSINGLRTIKEQSIPKGQHVLNFNSEDEETYYRFFTLKSNYSNIQEKTVQFDQNKERQINTLMKYREQRLNSVLNTSKELGSISGEIFNQKKSTYDVSIQHGRSIDEEQETRDSNAIQFTDLAGQYRYYSPDSNIYWSADAKLRTGSGYNALFGNFRADWLPQNSPFQYTAYINDWIYSGSDTDLNAYKLGLSAAYNFNYKYKHRLTTRLAGFYQDRISDNLSDEDFQTIPNAIWSRYKENHKFGLSASQSWTYDAYKDAQFYANTRLQTNQDIISFDYVQAGIGYRQLYDTASLDAAFINRSYFKDSNRESAFNSSRIRLSADWLFRSNENQAFKVGLSYFNNFTAKDSAYALNFTWLNHQGNYLEDYRPGEYRFRKARELRMLEDTFADQQQ